MSEDPEKEIQVTDVSSNKSANPSPSSKPRPNSLQSLKNYLTVEVATAHADILLLTCCIISGLVDSTIYHAYGTFVSMQTVLPFPLLQTPPNFASLHPPSLRSQLLIQIARAIRFSLALVVPPHTTPPSPTAGSNPSSPSSASVSAASPSASSLVSSRHSAAQPSSPHSSSNHSSF